MASRSASGSVRAGSRSARPAPPPTARARAARPAARRRAGIRWDRVGRAALLAVLGIILLLYVSPVHRWLTQTHAASEQRAELRALQREHDRLAARLRELRRPDAVERAARELGMVRRGERPFVIEDGPPPPP